MTIYARCQCNALLQGPEEFAGKRALCPACGSQALFPMLPPKAAVASVVISEPAPAASAPPPAPRRGEDDIVDVIEFLDPPAPPPIRTPPPRPAPAVPHLGPRSEPHAAPIITPIVDRAAPPPNPPAPPAKPAEPAEPEEPWAAKLLEAMLDPHAIQWMLMLGGGLMVIGLIIFLISQEVFKDPFVLAGALAFANFALLATGWYLKLKTQYQTAGRAIAFLACVVLPLNLWFYSHNGILTLDGPATLWSPGSGNLWVGALGCTLLYIATVFVLRDALFMYAVEIGVSLTAVLILCGPVSIDFLGDNATELSLVFLVLALISIHLERAFMAEGEFPRAEYGMPLFWSGQVQLAAALGTLIGSEVLVWFEVPRQFAWSWTSNVLSNNTYVAAGIWAAGAYAYLYSDLVVRRAGYYAYLAAVCVLCCIGTLLAPQTAEVIIIVFAIASVIAAMAYHTVSAKDEEDGLTRALPPLTALLAALPLVIGIVLHIRETNPDLLAPFWKRGAETPAAWIFVAAMAVVMAANRVSAYLFEEKHEGYSTAFYVFSGCAALIGAAGLLRLTGVPELQLWLYQAPILMLIPIAYLVASRLYRGRKPEEPLGLVAHAGAATIVICGLFSKFGLLETIFSPKRFEDFSQWGLEHNPNLIVAVLFALTAVFYGLATVFRRRSVNIYFATAAACLCVWQLLAYANITPPYYTVFYALVGLGLHMAAFALGLESVDVYDKEGKKEKGLAGSGLVAFQCGAAILLVACIAAGWWGLMQLARPADADVFVAVFCTAACSLVALFLVPSGGWRQTYVVATSALCVVGGLHLYKYLSLHPARQLEIAVVAIGAILLVASHIGRYRRAADSTDDLPRFGLSLGALMVIVPLFVAMVVKRANPDFDGQNYLLSIPDELAIATGAIVLLLSGLILRVRATTILGGLALTLYLLIVVGMGIYQSNLWIGAYLAAGGALIFGAGVALSIYRDRLIALPEQIKNREGVFQVLDWA